MSTIHLGVIVGWVVFMIIVLRTPFKAARELTGLEILDKWAGKPAHPYRIIPPDEILKFPLVAKLVKAIADNFRERPDVFKECFLPLIKIAIEYAQLLPASQRHHHSYPLGLIVHSLDVCRRMLAETSDMGPFTPHLAVPEGYERFDYLRNARICIGLLGLAHDLPKVSTDMTIQFLHDKTLEPSKIAPYDAHRAGGLYSEPLFKYAVRCFGQKHARYRPYRVTYRSDRQMNAHDKDVFQIINAMLSATETAIPQNIRSEYLFASSDFYRETLLPLRQRADRRSVEADLEINPVEKSAVAEECGRLLQYLALQGKLRDLPIVRHCRFLSLDALEKLLHDVPDLADFSCIPTKPHEAERLLHEFKANGFHSPMGDRESSPYAFDKHDGKYGLLLSPRNTAAILWYENQNPGEDASCEHQDPTANSEKPSAEDGSSLSQDEITRTTGVESKPSTNPHRSHRGQTGKSNSEPRIGANLCEYEVGDDENPNVAYEFQRMLERLCVDDFADSNRFRVCYGRLEVLKSECARILDELGFTALEDHRDFISQSNRSFGEWWTAMGGDLVEKVICTKAYTQALLDTYSTSNILAHRK